jgi:hypothetical protein
MPDSQNQSIPFYVKVRQPFDYPFCRIDSLLRPGSYVNGLAAVILEVLTSELELTPSNLGART